MVEEDEDVDFVDDHDADDDNGLVHLVGASKLVELEVVPYAYR